MILWKAPEAAQLSIDVRSQTPQTLRIGFNRDEHVAEVKLVGDGQWQSVVLSVADFRDRSGKALADWSGIMELKLAPKHKGDPRPEFRNLRWAIDEKEFNIESYGAIGDGVAMETEAIQNTIDACYEAGEGIVLVPARDFVTGTIHLKSNVTLSLDYGASLLGSRDMKDFPE